MDDHENKIEKEYDSQLGTKDYWENFYKQEISNFELDNDFESHVWFGNQVQKKVVEYINKEFTDKNVSIIDIGCGNAVFLIKLFKAGFTNLKGVDYSQSSIDLAQKLIQDKSEKLLRLDQALSLGVEDINNPTTPFNYFKIICDKGTFDAFMLYKENKSEKYVEYILKKIHNDGGYFIITSCNHTRNELISYFCKESNEDKEDKDNSGIVFYKEIEHKKLMFGGSIGQTQTTLVFKVNLI